jgi:small subunit ribosomal protein S16
MLRLGYNTRLRRALGKYLLQVLGRAVHLKEELEFGEHLEMVRMRLRRTGAKNNPAYRIVVADQKSPRDGSFLDTIGHYLPTRQPAVVEIDEAKAREWLAKGAQPSDTVASLLKAKGVTDSNGKATVASEQAAEATA